MARFRNPSLRSESLTSGRPASLPSGFDIPAFTEQALCAQTDPEMFFPDRSASSREAKAICALCPVTAECLAYALANGERFGVWGGVSERARRRMERDIETGAA